MERTILVAIDGSVYSSNSLDYLAQLFGADRGLSIHLLSVVAGGGADKDWMYDVDPLRAQTPGSEKHAALARRRLKEAEERLTRNGFCQGTDRVAGQDRLKRQHRHPRRGGSAAITMLFSLVAAAWAPWATCFLAAPQAI